MNLKYVLKGLIRHHVPDKWFFHLMELSGRTRPAESDPNGVFAMWKERFDSIGLSLEGRHVVEVGSGRYARLALHMLSSGASRVTLIDLYAVPLHKPEHRSMLAQDCTNLGLDADALQRIDVITGDFNSVQVPPFEMKADIVISSATLEHVHDPQRLWARCWEWLKPGGATLHIIDLRDHSSGYPFEMLTFSDKVWERWFNPKGGFHLNRWRITDYLRAMHEVGFENVCYEGLQKDEPGLMKVMPRLHERFHGISRDLLSLLVVHLYGEKPHC